MPTSAITLRHRLAQAAWVALCVAASASLIGGMLAGVFGVVLAPFAFIGWLIGPSEHLNLSRYAPTILTWAGALVFSAAVAVLSCRRSAALYRSAAGSAVAKKSSMMVGALAGIAVAAAGLQAKLAPTPQEIAERQAEVAALPASDADRQAFEHTWLPRARAGDAYAQFVVGEVLHNGAMGQPQQLRLAAQWLDKSAQQGDPDGRLSVLIANLEGRLGLHQNFNIPVEIEAFASTQPRWRRVALQLWLSKHPVVVKGSGAPDMVAIAEWRNAWLEKAAREGSRYAAFSLGRELENARAADNSVAPDFEGAMYWYGVAGSQPDVDRLQRSTGRLPSTAASPVITGEAANAELIERLRQRSELVALRQRGRVVSPGTDDAKMHFIAYVEASGQYRLLADAASDQRRDAAYQISDTQLAIFFYSLAAADGDESAIGRLAELASH